MQILLVTGASGYVGSHLVARLVHQQHYDTIYILIRPNSHRLPQNYHGTLFGDLCDFESLERLPELKTITHVVHCGASVQISRPEEALETNDQGTRNLWKALNHKVLQHFIFLSTTAALCPPEARVPSHMKPQWINTTNFSTGPITNYQNGDAYSTSKRLAESFLQHEAETHGITLTCFFPSTIIGGDSPSSSQGQQIMNLLRWGCAPKFHYGFVHIQYVVDMILQSLFLDCGGTCDLQEKPKYFPLQEKHKYYRFILNQGHAWCHEMAFFTLPLWAMKLYQRWCSKTISAEYILSRWDRHVFYDASAIDEIFLTSKSSKRKWNLSQALDQEWSRSSQKRVKHKKSWILSIFFFLLFCFLVFLFSCL
jgi:nucleoside-diphosphate-sugar epimerase